MWIIIFYEHKFYLQKSDDILNILLRLSASWKKTAFKAKLLNFVLQFQ